MVIGSGVCTVMVSPSRAGTRKFPSLFTNVLPRGEVTRTPPALGIIHMPGVPAARRAPAGVCGVRQPCAELRYGRAGLDQQVGIDGGGDCDVETGLEFTVDSSNWRWPSFQGRRARPYCYLNCQNRWFQ